jgi:hypothetical protein
MLRVSGRVRKMSADPAIRVVKAPRLPASPRQKRRTSSR